MADYDKDMAEERIKIRNAKADIYQDDKEKKEAKKKKAKKAKKSHAKMYEKSPAGFTPELKKASVDGKLTGKFKQAVDAAPTKMSAELKYMPIVDREKSTMSAMGSHKILKHMKGRM